VSLSASGDEGTVEVALDRKKDSGHKKKKEEVKEVMVPLQHQQQQTMMVGKSTRAVKPLPDNFIVRKTAMKSILKEVCSSSFAEPFLLPVDEEEAPGYTDLIEHPMDLSTMRKRVASGLYDNNPAEFVRDTRLIWHNCALYNDINSQIVSWAFKVGDIFEEQLQLAMAAEKEDKGAGDSAASSKDVIIIKRDVKSGSKDIASTSKEVRNKDASIVEKDSKSTSRDATASLKTVKIIHPIEAPLASIGIDASNTASKDAVVKRKIKLKLEEKAPDVVTEEQGHDGKKIHSTTVRKLKKLWREVYHHELAPPFQYPVSTKDVPGYTEIVKHPIDLSTIKSKIAKYEDSPSTFLADMCLIFDNCQLFNLENSELYTAASVLRAFTEQRYKETFSSSSRRRSRNKSISGRSASVKDEDGARASGSVSPVKASERKHAADAEHEHETHGQNSKSSGQSSKPYSSGSGTVSSSSKGPIQSTLRYPDTIPELNGLIAQIEQARDNFSSNEFVRDRCFRQAADLLIKTKMPFTVAPQIYVVKRFGSLIPSAPICDYELLNPIGYTCSRSLRLCVVSDSYQQDLARSSSIKIPFVTVDLKSSVEMTGSNAVWFTVTLENGTGISRCKSPKEAWIDALGKEAGIVRVLGSKLKRCRAVFNRLCISPDALAFLEQVPLTGTIGVDYYTAITAPMWLREVHSRLSDGTYDIEFDFAWDVRLIFKNCMEYNSADSELYKCATRLSELFELLFLNWVINVQDKSVDDLAVGAWDDWYRLRYFDAADHSENICAMTGTKGPASLMLQCRHCEDQNLQSLHPKVSGSKDWVCARCSDALEQTGGDLSANPFTNIGLKSLRNVDSYSCEIFGGNWFVPAPELGAGWSQARRKHKSGLKNWFLSPLGYEVTSREDAASQSSYEEEINRNLYDARAAEFQAQQMKSNKSSQQVKDVKKTARHNRKRNEYQSPEKALIKSTEEESTIDFGKLEDEGRICTGKLYNFVIPDGFCLKWFVCSDETDIISRFEQNLDISNQLESRVPLEVNALPSSGFFGLEITAIRSRMEGLENSINCKQYRYLDAVKCAEQILDELRSATRRFEAINSSQDKLNKCLLKERWKIERELVYPAVPPTYFSNSDKSLAHKVGFRELFPSVISSEQGELLLCLWEYLYHNHVTSKVMDTLSMYDLISSLIPSGSVLPTYGQVVFDEVCCMLVDVLYLQIRKNVSHIFHGPMDEECNWNSTMAVRPMNILTWPHLALEAIRILSFPLLPLETSKVLERPLDLIKCPQRDLLCLLFNHPLIDQFLVLVPDEHVHSQSLNAASGTLRFMKEFFSNPDAYSKPITDDNAESMLFRSIGPFSSALRTLFRDITTIEGLDDTRRLFSANILSWLNDLCKRWDILDEAAAYSSTDLAQQLDVDSLVFNSKRFWGGYTLSGISLAKEDLLLPSCFNKVQKSQYVEKMAMLLMLEKYMLLVSKSEPDDWSTADRAVVYAVLLDQCITVSDFTAPQITKYEQTTKKFNQVDDIPIAPSKVVDLPIIDVHKSGEPDLTCHFSGLSFSTDNSIKWVYVPSEYQQYPIEEVSTNTTSCLTSSSSQLTTDTSSQTAVLRGSRLSNTSSGGTMRAPVALLTVMCKLIAARELATNDASRYEVMTMSPLLLFLFLLLSSLLCLSSLWNMSVH